MNAPIRRVAIVAALMMFSLLLNATWLTVARTDELNAHPMNRRTRDAEFAQNRGAILAGNTAIAQTVPNEGRFAFKRTYADGALYAPVTGHYSYDFARSGLEQVYNSQLAGTDDSQFVDRIVERPGNHLPFGIARNGGDIGAETHRDPRDRRLESGGHDRRLLDPHQPVVDHFTLSLIHI